MTTSRVLVVDSEESAVDDLEAALRRAGLEPMSALEGVTAIKLFEEFRPSVVLIGVRASGIDPRALARAFRARSNDVPLLFMGYGAPGDAIRAPSEALDAGGDYYFRLPTDLGYLAGRVRGWTRTTSAFVSPVDPQPAYEELYSLSAELDGDLDLEGLNDRPSKSREPQPLATLRARSSGGDEGAAKTLVTHAAHPDAFGSGSSPPPSASPRPNDPGPAPTRSDWPRRPSGSIDTARALVREAEALRSAGRVDDAIETYRSAADLYSRDGDVRPAVALYKLLLYLDPTRIDMAFQGATFAARHGDRSDARAMIERASVALEREGRPHDGLDLISKFIEVAGPDAQLRELALRLDASVPPAPSAVEHRPGPLRFPPEAREPGPWASGSLDLSRDGGRNSDDLYPDDRELMHPGTRDLQRTAPASPLTSTRDPDLIFEEPIEVRGRLDDDQARLAAIRDAPKPVPVAVEANDTPSPRRPRPGRSLGAATPEPPPAIRDETPLRPIVVTRDEARPAFKFPAAEDVPKTNPGRGDLDDGKIPAPEPIDSERLAPAATEAASGESSAAPRFGQPAAAPPSKEPAPMSVEPAAPKSDGPAPAPVSGGPAPAPVSGGPAPAPVSGGPAPAPVSGGPAAVPAPAPELRRSAPSDTGRPAEADLAVRRTAEPLTHEERVEPWAPPALPVFEDDEAFESVTEEVDITSIAELAILQAEARFDTEELPLVEAPPQRRPGLSPNEAPPPAPPAQEPLNWRTDPPPSPQRPRVMPARANGFGEGTLKELPDGLEVLGELYAMRATGVIKGPKGQLVIATGQPCGLRGDGACHDLIATAQRRHSIPLDALPPRLEPVPSPAVLAQHLVSEGILTETERTALLHTQFEAGLGAWLRSTGQWSFQATEVFRNELLEPLPDVRRTLIDLLEDAPDLPVDAQVTVRCGTLAPDLLNRRDTRFAALLDGYRSIEDAAGIAGLPVPRARAVTLVLLGFRLAVVTGKSDGSGPRRASARPQPEKTVDFGTGAHAVLQALHGSERVRAMAEMVRMNDYFTMLGIDEHAAANDIDEAHDRLRRLVPHDTGDLDAGVQALAREVIRSLDEARDVLKVPELRTAYLRHLQR